MTDEKSDNVKEVDSDKLFQTLDRVTAWIENCDTKASIVLGGIGVVFGILLTSDYVNKTIEIFQHMIYNIGFWSGMYMVISTLAFFTVVAGAFFLIRVLIPKTNPQTYREKGIDSDSLIFFQTIAKNKTLQAYKSKVIDCTEESFCNDIISQIYICALRCDEKFYNYKTGLILSILGFTVFAVMMVIGAFIV